MCSQEQEALCARERTQTISRLKMVEEHLWEPTKIRIVNIFRSKIISKLKVATGGGSTTGSHLHRVEIDPVNHFAAKCLLFDLPRQGPKQKGQTVRYNWQVAARSPQLTARNPWPTAHNPQPALLPAAQVTVEQQWMLEKLLSLETTRLGKGKALDAAVMRKRGAVMVMAIPPFLVEHRDNGDDQMQLVLSFYHLELNRYGVIHWPPAPIYDSQEEYSTVEAAAWQQLYRLWDDERVSMHPRFQRLVAQAQHAGLARSDSEAALSGYESEVSAPDSELE